MGSQRVRHDWATELNWTDLFWDPPLSAHPPLGQDGSWSEGFWEEQDSLWPGIIPWLLTHKESFCACVVSPLSQKGENRDLLSLYSNRALPPLCPCHAYFLKVFTRNEHWLFILFLLLLPFWRANRRPIVNALTGAHLSLSENANSCKYPAWNPLLHAPLSANRRPVVNVQPGAHLSPTLVYTNYLQEVGRITLKKQISSSLFRLIQWKLHWLLFHIL